MQAVIDFPYPVIAMINGFAYGAGCELAVTCDIRIAADHARFSVPPAKLGIVYRWRGILKLIDIVGLATAKEMFFTGRAYEASHQRMSAEEIREIEALRDQAFRSEDVKEGQQAFREKRKPVFRGR